MLAEAESALETALPISAVLPEVVAALAESGAAVLVSPPGTGKTTLVPLAIADAVSRSPTGASAAARTAAAHPPAGRPAAARPAVAGGRVIVAEPRRMAVRAAARRMASLLGEPVGARIGYSIRGERRTSADTLVEVVTTGMLVQRLQRDPELPGVAAIIIDECHERHLDTDLALAFTIDTRAVLRPDLQVLATSATAQADRLAVVLGEAPVIGADAPLFPVEEIWAPPATVLDPPRGLRVDRRLLLHVASVVRRAVQEQPGDVLVLLPGVGEIGSVERHLSDLEGIEVLRLHGQLSHQQQDDVLRPSAGRRVVLATAVAESSLTVPGVRVVVDAGLARVPRMDVARGLGALTTVRVSRAGAQQRAGRAGREASGAVYRCWSQAENARLPAHPEPEVAIADLTGFALALARWGDPDGSGLALLDAPPAAAMTIAQETLHALGAVDPDGRITPRGQQLAQAGVHPRLARALLDGAGLIGASHAAEVVAVLALDEGPTSSDDLAQAWRQVRSPAASGGPRSPLEQGRARAWRDETQRLTAAAIAMRATTGHGRERGSGNRETARTSGLHDRSGHVSDDLAAGMIAALAFPERLAKARAGQSNQYLMANGTAAALAPGSRLTGSPWLAIAVAQRPAGATNAVIRMAAAIDEESAKELGADQLSTVDEVSWAAGDVRAVTVERLGAIPLTTRPLTTPPSAAVEEALREGLRQEGLGLLTWTPAALALRARMAFCHQAEPENAWPDVSDDALLARFTDWLGPELLRARRRRDLAAVHVANALRNLLGHREYARLEEVAPERAEVPAGSRIRIDYGQDFASPPAPVLAVKLQETFGWRSTPRIGGGRVPLVLHLLSPAGRPIAVTSDLESFWRNIYPQVRGELRGRYPRHPWPEDPLTATPTRRLKPRS